MVIMMHVSFRQMILLSCLKKLNGERTIYSIYHLLQGKKSSQTIQDASLFELSNFFYTEPSITREELDMQSAELQAAGFITETAEHHFVMTEQGEAALEEALVYTPIPLYVNGWKYGRTGIRLWERLSLAIQVISHLQHRETKYIPVQRRPETLFWVKDFLKIHALSRNDLARKLFTELTDCLEGERTINPVIRHSAQRLRPYRFNSKASSTTNESRSGLLSLSFFKCPPLSCCGNGRQNRTVSDFVSFSRQTGSGAIDAFNEKNIHSSSTRCVT